jgi:hypothetical protein
MRFRRQPPEPSPEGEPAPAPESPPEDTPAEQQAPPPEDARPSRPLYHPGQLRRQRRALVHAREERIRDLGGLILEMFRRDRFREDLMREQAEEVFGMESRIQEIDAMLTTTRQQVQAARCECGAPIVWGSHFCANCGRPTGEAVVSCTNCGHPLPADARFCGNCGTAAPSSAERQAAEEGKRTKDSEPAQDPWES